LNKRKLFTRIVNNQKNVKFNDFVAIVEAYKFYNTRSEGSHFIYKNASIPEIINLQNENSKAKPYQIKQFLAIIEKYNLDMEDY